MRYLIADAFAAPCANRPGGHRFRRSPGFWAPWTFQIGLPVLKQTVRVQQRAATAGTARGTEDRAALMQVGYRPFGSLRFFLAASVVVSHSMPLEAPNSFLAQMGIGNFAVMGFFVLSGFII